MNVTIPPGTTAPGTPETVAVKITGWPYTGEPPEELTVVVVGAVLTRWTRAELVLELKFISPL